MQIDPKEVAMGVFVWEDKEGELNVGLSNNIMNDRDTAIILLTEAIQALIMHTEVVHGIAH
jgi:hypothetical protein